MRKQRLGHGLPEAGGMVCVTDKRSDAVAYLFTRTNEFGKPVYGATIFYGREAEPVSDDVYRTKAARDDDVFEWFAVRRVRNYIAATRREMLR